VLTDDILVEEVRKLASINQRLPVLLLLAHVSQPAKTPDIVIKGITIGFKKIIGWNVTHILRRADQANLVAQLDGGWRLLERGTKVLFEAGAVMKTSRVIPASDSVLPRELFNGTRTYIERVVRQINASYDSELYDCCAVMCRRIVETLIIEVYEHLDRAGDIKNGDGNFHMLSGLLNVILNDKTINLGRNSKRGLETLKELGDKSAHNRRFTAREADIDGIRTGLRTATEELLHLSGLAR
jgi:hypothetical protein